MSYHILDIETKPNEEFLPLFDQVKIDGRLKDPAKIAAARRKKTACDQDLCKIVCVGIKQIGKPGALYNGKDLEKWFHEHRDFNLVTFNGKGFDLPIIIKTGIRLNLDLPYSKLFSMTKKYQDNGHYDLMQLLSFGDISKVKNLDTYLRIYLNTQKETLGDDFFRNATDEDLMKHCLEDLQFTEDLFLKFSFLLQGDE